MIGRKSTIAAKAAAARGKASMNARGTSTSPPPGVSRGSPQSSVKARPASANERNLARAQQLNQRTSTTSQQRPMTGGVQNMNTGQIENLRSRFQANRQPQSNLSKALARRPVGGGQMSMGAGKVVSPSQPTPISGAPQNPPSGFKVDTSLRERMLKTPPKQQLTPPSGPGNNQFTGQNPGASQTPMGSPMGMKKGGMVKSKGIDGCATKGKTKGRYI